MARLRVLSDIHFEFHADGGAAFVESLGEPACDALVLAGDLCDYRMIEVSLALVCHRFRSVPVAYVLGNHEMYGGSPRGAEDAVRRAVRSNPNLVWLDASGADVAGLRLFGASLWFRYDRKSPTDHDMNDFHKIRGFREFVKVRSVRDREAVRAAAVSGAVDVMVTHHLPHPACILPEWKGSSLNRYFLHDGLTGEVEAGLAPLWIHGHTHGSVDLFAGRSRIVCNPFGYAAYDENASFDPSLTLDVEPRVWLPLG